MDLNTVWFLLIGILIIGYAVLDGFDLGIGSLYFLLAKSNAERRSLLNTIGPVWNANEVWLLTGGGALFAAFPPVYASVFSGFYLAMLLVLFGLILRAVSVEFRSHHDSTRWQECFDKLFLLGSLLPALLLGVAVGNIAKGLPLDAAGNYTGTFFDLLNPYALLFGLTGLNIFLMQGITYSLLKTEGAVFSRARSLAKPIWLGILTLFIVTTTYTWLGNPGLITNYFQHPVLYLIPLAAIVALALIPLAIKAAKYGLAFLASSLTTGGLILTLAAGLFPKLVPAQDPSRSLTIYNSASSPLTLNVMLIIAAMGVPIILFYTIYVYRVFRGPVKLDNSGY